MSLTVKVFFEHLNGPQEIRRFPINTSDTVDVFSMTKEKIMQLFPALANGRFTLYWQDPDGDRVAFSSSDEMKDAITHASNGVLRVYITETNESPEAADQHHQKTSGTEHHQKTSDRQPEDHHQDTRPNIFQDHLRVTCNWCGSRMSGTSYKCCVCPDYDLCQACADKGIHTEHDMFRISHPNFVFPPPQGGFFGSCPTGVAPGAFVFCNTDGNSSGTFRAAASNIRRAATHSGADNNQKDNRKEETTFKKEHFEFGTNISAFLDPFGIKVHYDLHDGNGSHKQDNFQHNWWGSAGPAWEQMFRRAHQSEAPGGSQSSARDDVPSNMTTASKDNTSNTGNPETSKDAANKAGNEQGTSHDTWAYFKENGLEIRIPTPFAIPLPAPSISVAACSPAPQPPTVASPPPRPTTGPQLPAGSTSPPRPATAPQQPPTVANPPPRPAQSPGSAVPPPRPATGPQLTGMPGCPSCPVAESQTNNLTNPQFQRGLEQMLNMGFVDTDGWLSALLVANNGDIGSTIDAIKAKATQQLDSLRERH